jgi:thiol-disulfide isomerase/thioredoxin
MRRACLYSALLLFLASPVAIGFALDQPSSTKGPADPKAQKTYNEGLRYLHDHNEPAALDNFKKADKQDGGRCLDCQKKMVKYGIELEDWKAAETGAEEMIAEAKEPREQALAHHQLGIVLFTEANRRHKDDFFARAHDEFTKAMAIAPNFPDALFFDGRTLAHMHQDDAAKTSFQKFVDMRSDDDPRRQRALRYIADPDLARARMTPAFALTTLDGQKLSMDDLKGKVVLLDFWATWCGPCREALPHIKEIAKKFHDQPLVVISINLDKEEQKWREFVAKNQMTWVQYWDGGFDGKIAKMFEVREIPQTFTIDADGVLQDQHVGDANLEGKLKKLVARARETQQQQTAQKPAPQPGK